jgi:hypothetical protein
MERSRSYSGNVPSNGSVKIGGLWKRSQGLSRFTRPNYRHRVFILTENALSYYSGTVDRVGQLKGRVALDAITAVEFVDESAFNLPHTFQVRLSSLSLSLYDSPCLSRSISCCSCCKRSVNLSFCCHCLAVC